jgi:hypothetical protein
VKNIILILLLSFGWSLSYAQAPDIGKSRKDVFTLWRQSYSKRAGEALPVLKLYPVSTDSSKYYTRRNSAQEVRNKNGAVVKGMFDYDPQDSTSLSIMVDAELLGLGLTETGVIDLVQADSLFQSIYVSNDEICFVYNNEADTTCVSVPSTADGTETILQVSDDTTFNFTLSGDGSSGSPYIVGGNVIVSDSSDNRIQELPGGLYVAPETDDINIVNYDAGNGCHVWASGTGVTFSKNTVSGEYTFTVPDGVDLYRAQVRGDTGDGDVGSEIFAIFDYQGSRTFNQDRQTAWVPDVNIYNGTTSFNRSSPALVDLNLIYGLSSIGSGDSEITIQNATTYFAQHVIVFNFL